MSPTFSPVLYSHSSAHAVLVMKPALEFADDANFAEIRSEPKRQHSVSTRLFLALVRPFNKTLEEMKDSILQMEPDEARSILNELAAHQTIVSDMRQEIADGGVLNDASEIEHEMFRLAKNMVTIFDDLKMVAENAPVDENSAEYQRFMEKLISENEASPTIPGRKSLLALFE